MLVSGWESYYTTWPHYSTASTASPDVDWGRECFTQQSSDCYQPPDNLFAGVLDHLPVRHKCSFFNFFVLIESSLSAVVLCAISIWTKKAGAAVCGPGVPQMIIDWGQCKVGMSEVKWLYPGAQTDQGETWGTDSSPAEGQRLQTKPFRITLQYQTWSLSYRLTNQYWVPPLTTPQVLTKGK